MSVPAPRRTVEDIDHDLVEVTATFEQAVHVWAANSAELAWIRIDQLLDERLGLRAAT